MTSMTIREPAIRHTPLARHVFSQTTDPGRAAVEGARAMPPHRLHIRPAERFSSDLHAAGIGDSTLVYLAYGWEVELDAVAPMDYYTLQVVLRGGFEVTTEFGEATVTPGSGCVLSPGERLRIRFAPGTAQIAAKVPAAVVERAVGGGAPRGYRAAGVVAAAMRTAPHEPVDIARLARSAE